MAPNALDPQALARLDSTYERDTKKRIEDPRRKAVPRHWLKYHEFACAPRHAFSDQWINTQAAARRHILPNWPKWGRQIDIAADHSKPFTTDWWPDILSGANYLYWA